ncbi:MAG: N-acetylmuramoyl-L-alanine amidase [Candidatus Peribacteria bacterium]|nr:N-acetylmuramoyl-L-alanine amidase [Candidatus Peribacteria bacterium]
MKRLALLLIVPVAFFLQAHVTQAAEQPLTRAEALQMVVLEVYPYDSSFDCKKNLAPSLPVTYTHFFSDVSITDKNAVYVCEGIAFGLIRGNRDGNFRPDNSINIAEVSKLLAVAYGTALPDSAKIRPLGWHWRYTEALKRKGVLDWRTKDYAQTVTQTELLAMIHKLEPYKPRILAENAALNHATAQGGLSIGSHQTDIVQTAAGTSSSRQTLAHYRRLNGRHATVRKAAPKPLGPTIGNYHMRLIPGSLEIKSIQK